MGWKKLFKKKRKERKSDWLCVCKRFYILLTKYSFQKEKKCFSVYTAKFVCTNRFFYINRKDLRCRHPYIYISGIFVCRRWVSYGCIIYGLVVWFGYDTLIFLILFFSPHLLWYRRFIYTFVFYLL